MKKKIHTISFRIAKGKYHKQHEEMFGRSIEANIERLQYHHPPQVEFDAQYHKQGTVLGDQKEILKAILREIVNFWQWRGINFND